MAVNPLAPDIPGDQPPKLRVLPGGPLPRPDDPHVLVLPETLPRIRDLLDEKRQLPLWEQGIPLSWRPLWEQYRRLALLDTEQRARPDRLQNYGTAYKQLAQLLLPGGLEPGDVTSAEIELFIADLRDNGMAESTVNARFRALRAIYNKLVDAKVLSASPLEGLVTPKVTRFRRPRRPIAIEEQRALLDACVPDAHAKGKRFEAAFLALRDRAMISFDIDTGVRASGLVSMTVAGADLGQRCAIVRLKDGSEATVRYGDATSADLVAYLEARSRHPHAALPAFWLGERGALGKTGARRGLKRRAVMGGVPRSFVYQHAFRYTMANYFSDKVSTTTTAALGNWKDERMAKRYAEWGAEGRAREAMDRLSPRDRLG